ncbi:Dehydrogenase/reductase SDR family member 7C-A [Labeo rohita]|uniref:Dehydrogenase/reductase SDR family member 7C-A n=1 Tax=Labeo rohita TaxID=84645 RepID=A0ABQ8M7F6_LABRO|nr:Dehydrogenase/reductase SDR family member 7C-A [Labeo rohita]
MGLPSVMVLPLLIVVFAGVYYVYNEVMRFMSKSMVRNKVVVITDAVSGMGSECARLFHEGGARLVLCGPNWDKLESLYDSLCSGSDPSKRLFLCHEQWQDILVTAKCPQHTFTPKLVLLDFSDMENISEVITEIGECYGCVDVLICNSSMKVKAPVQNLSLEMDKTVMDVNYFGPITLAKGVLPSMITRRTGQFVLVNSIQGKLALPFRTCSKLLQIDVFSDAASKHAVQAFFDCLRAEVEEYGISVSTISHTFINAVAENGAPSKTPPTNPLWAYISSKLNTHGVSPSSLAHEIVRTVNRQNREVLLAHPVPWVALYIRSLLPSFFFAVVAAGVKDGAMAEQLK